MKLTVNGRPHEHHGAGTISALLLEMDAEPERVAVMVNDEVIPRAARESVTLKEHDRIEVLSFCGGG
jgi:thiamine biosynthesis protein ThiS